MKSILRYVAAAATALLCAAPALTATTTSTCAWRVSNATAFSGLSDALLLTRHARGLRGTALIANTNATDSASVEAQVIARTASLDVDGDGSFNALDAAAIAKTLLGFQGGPPLPNGCEGGGQLTASVTVIGLPRYGGTGWVTADESISLNTALEHFGPVDVSGTVAIPIGSFSAALTSVGSRLVASVESPNATAARIEGRPVRGLTLAASRVDTTVVSPLTNLIDSLRTSGGISLQAAETQVQQQFGITATELYSVNPADATKRTMNLLAAAYAGYQDASEVVFDTRGRSVAIARDLATSRIMSALPLIHAQFAGAAVTYDDAQAILTENAFFPAVAEIADSVVQTMQTLPLAASLSTNTAPKSLAADAYCPEADVGISYRELGKMIFGSDNYRVGLNEQLLGVNQLFAGSCNAVRNMNVRKPTGGWHTGVDYQVLSANDTPDVRRAVPQYSVVDGTVAYVSPANPAGGTTNYGIVAITDSRNAQRIWRYLHLDRIDVAVGDTVTKGCQIGLSGGTGDSRSTFAVHAHIEVQEGPTVTGSGISNYQDVRADVPSLGFKNPRTLIDNFAEPTMQRCDQALPTLNWRYAGSIAIASPRLVRAAGFNSRGNIYVVNDLSVVSTHSPSTFGKIAADIVPVASDFGVVGTIPNLYTTAVSGAKLVLGANGAHQIPVLDLDERRVIDRIPFTGSAMGRTRLVRDRAGYPEVTALSSAADSLAVGMAGTWTSDGSSTVEMLSFPDGVAKSAYVRVAGGACSGLLAYTNRIQLSGFVTTRCSTNELLYINTTTLTAFAFATLPTQATITRLAVSKNGDKVLAATDDSVRKVTLFNLADTGLGRPTVASQLDFGGQYQYPLYPRFDESEQRIYVQRYRDYQIYSQSGTLVQTIDYPVGVTGTPATATAQLTFNASGTRLLIPLSSKVLVYNLEP